MNKIKNQSGFSAVEGLLIIVIVVIVGVVGWYVWNNRNSVKSANVPTVSSVSSSPTVSSTKVVTTTLGKTPQGLQTAVSNNWKAAGCILPNGNVGSAGNTTGTSIASSQTYYMAGKAARVNGCDSFSYYSNINGKWTYDTGGQANLSCSTYLEYKIPAALVAAGTGSSTAKCLNASNTGLETYTGN